MSELEQAAAAITAAFVQKGKSGYTTEAEAAKKYFDCLARLQDEKKGRTATRTPPGPNLAA